jgi:hypothetical protein
MERKEFLSATATATAAKCLNKTTVYLKQGI